MYFYSIFALIAVVSLLYLYWRFFFFYRNPEREIPIGKNIISPADGTVVYITKIDAETVPVSIKKGREIRIQEIFIGKKNLPPSYLVGIFMHPSSVHVNRAPIEGKVSNIVYTKSKNLPMTIMWWRVLLGLRPYERYSSHILQNERNMISFEGEIPVSIVQIADIYVNKIECWVEENQIVAKGERVGMIKMGSQVDMIFPVDRITNINITIGQKVKAGESVIASFN